MNRIQDNKRLCKKGFEAQKLLTESLPQMNETLTITTQMAVILPYVEDISISLAVIADELTGLREQNRKLEELEYYRSLFKRIGESLIDNGYTIDDLDTIFGKVNEEVNADANND